MDKFAIPRAAIAELMLYDRFQLPCDKGCLSNFFSARRSGATGVELSFMVKVYGAVSEAAAFYALNSHLKALSSTDLEGLRAELNTTSLIGGELIRIGDVQGITAAAVGVVQSGADSCEDVLRALR